MGRTVSAGPEGGGGGGGPDLSLPRRLPPPQAAAALRWARRVSQRSVTVGGGPGACRSGPRLAARPAGAGRARGPCARPPCRPPAPAGLCFPRGEWRPWPGGRAGLSVPARSTGLGVVRAGLWAWRAAGEVPVSVLPSVPLPRRCGLIWDLVGCRRSSDFPSSATPRFHLSALTFICHCP